MMTHSNYLFLLPFNPFPLISMLSFFSFLVGTFFSLKLDFVLLSLSASCSLFSGLNWWVCYSSESYDQGSFTFNLSEGLKFSFLLFISSEIFFFFLFFEGTFIFF